MEDDKHMQEKKDKALVRIGNLNIDQLESLIEFLHNEIHTE